MKIIQCDAKIAVSTSERGTGYGAAAEYCLRNIFYVTVFIISEASAAPMSTAVHIKYLIYCMHCQAFSFIPNEFKTSTKIRIFK